MKNNVGLVIQTVLSVAIVAFVCMYFVTDDVLIILQSLMSLFMFVLAFNNHFTFKRSNKYTIAYIVIGIIIIGAMLF